LTVIEDPWDPFYPFAHELYGDELTAYHGTWSTSGASIERYGLRADRLPYRQEDVEALCAACDQFEIAAIAPVAVFAAHYIEGTRPMHLTQDYWKAAYHASLAGGETVFHALRAIGELEAILLDRGRRSAHAEQLKERRRHASGKSGIGCRGCCGISTMIHSLSVCVNGCVPSGTALRRWYREATP
jgi:hypothetical protein